MSITDQIEEMLHRARQNQENTRQFQETYNELLNKGLVQKREYDLPVLDVLGYSQKPIFIQG